MGSMWLRHLLVLVLIPRVCGQVVTPPRELGLVYGQGSAYAKIHLEVYLDLICPDSKEAWPHIKNVATYYGPNNVRLTVQLFPLPYHQNAFYASRAAFVVHHLSNGTKTFAWIEKILDEMSELTDSAFHNRSNFDLLQMYAGYAGKLGLNITAFLELTDRRHYNVFEKYTRHTWKRACTLGVAATPTYILNGIIHPNILQSWDLDQWKLFLDPLLLPQLFDEARGVTSAQNSGARSTSSTNAGSSLRASPICLVIYLTTLLAKAQNYRF